MKNIKLTAIISKHQNRERLDKSLSIIFNKKYSRSCIKKWILKNLVTVNNIIINKAKKKVKHKDKIIINVTDYAEKNLVKWVPQNIKLNIIYEDKDILVINKPNNIIVHPGVGNKTNTILNALIYHYPNNMSLPRAGIVHRLDKNTTGLMIIAKNINSYFFLVNLLKKREINREYEAIVLGNIKDNGMINQPIKRNINKRMRMMVHQNGKPAITYYSLIERFNNYSHIKLNLETGRTHQIRVHMSYINHFIIGDQTYKKKIKNIKKSNSYIDKAVNNFSRQALHATKLTLLHPNKKNKICFKSPISEDMQKLIDILKKHKITF